MPQLDPFLIFLQSCYLIFFYLIFYFFFFRNKIFPFFFVNFKINYYLILKLTKKITRTFYNFCCYLFGAKIFQLITIKFLSHFFINSHLIFFIKVDNIFKSYTLFSNFSDIFALATEINFIEEEENTNVN